MITVEPILLDVELSVEEYNVGMETEIVVNQIVGDEYEGPYEFTPTQETQTVAIGLKTALQDITINPIPSNYGLITWDGAVMTIT